MLTEAAFGEQPLVFNQIETALAFVPREEYPKRRSCTSKYQGVTDEN